MSDLQCLGLLRRVRVLAVGVNLEFPQHRVAERSLGQHALYRALQRTVRKARVQLGEIGFLDAARVRGVPVVFLAEQLAPGHADLGRIQHDDEIAGIDMRRVFRLVLAAQAHRDLGREATENLVLGVHHVPTVNGIFCFGAESLHYPVWLSEKSREWYQVSIERATFKDIKIITLKGIGW